MEPTALEIIVVVWALAMLFIVYYCTKDNRKRSKNQESKITRPMVEESEEEDDEYEETPSRFYYLNDWDEFFNIHVDRETRVQYLECCYCDGLTVLINSDGKPILYTGNFEDEEIKETDEEKPERFYFIEDAYALDFGDTFDIYVDRETLVQYIEFSNRDGITALIGADGKPILYSGNFDE
jgi:hypothetical protein